VLVCPKCRSELRRRAPSEPPNIDSSLLECTACAAQYPVINGIPRFVQPQNYAGNFGLQWNSFRRTQLDSHSGTQITHDRFYRQSGWSPEELAGKRVLDVGCGAGRFAEIALASGAQLVAVDYSSAVEATRENLGNGRNLDIIQADIYELPFQPNSFDFIYCFGVLQHTPNVRRAFDALTALVKSGGRLAVDVYPWRFRNFVKTKTWIRPLTKRMRSERLFDIVQRTVPRLLPLSVALGRVPFVGRWLRHALPISNYEGLYPLTPEQIEEWAVLDTFDMLGPRYDSPQTAESVRSWFTEAGFKSIEVFRAEQLVGRGQK
jgi:SAM-dependent methyltransferase